MWLPGDPPRRRRLERMLRVDHAGEFGAERIYEGQLAIVRRGPARAVIAEMLEQEQEHLAAFDRLLPERRVRPTMLMPLWRTGGWLLGAATARLSVDAAMACTVAVESVIDAHYADQIEALEDVPEESELRATLVRFREDEQHHHDTGLAHGAERAAAYPLLTAAIRTLTRGAIAAASRI